MSSFFIMLVNPWPILVFGATLTALGVHGWKDAYLGTAALVAGVFLGSGLWAPILATAVAYFKPQLSQRQLRLANRIAGVFIMGFGTVVCIMAI
jgi:arginine exporter protein ArgO